MRDRGDVDDVKLFVAGNDVLRLLSGDERYAIVSICSKHFACDL